MGIKPHVEVTRFTSRNLLASSSLLCHDASNFFRRKKSCKEKLNILRVVPMTTLLDQKADFFLYILALK